MPALVAHADECLYFSPSALNSCRRYETRRSPSAVPVQADSDQNLKQSTRKSTAPDAPSGNTSLKGPSVKTSLAVEQEVYQSKPAELLLGDGAAAPASDDIPHNLLRLDKVTPSHDIMSVLRYLTRPIPGTSRKEFPGVGAQEYHTIQRFVGESDQVLTKPRLSYNYISRLLTIDMPSTLHEEPFDYLKECLTLAIASFPYDRDVIRPSIKMNYQLQIQDASVMPDMTIALTSVDGPTEVVLIPGLGECALSEDRARVFTKMEDEIAAHPEAEFAVIVVIVEAITYASPAKDTPAWTALRNGDEDEPFPLSLKSFIKRRSTPRSFDHAVTVAGHRWCHVQSVEYNVWTKSQNGPIDIRNLNPANFARGTLVPGGSDMGAFTRKLEEGLRQMRDVMVNFSKEIDPDLDCSELEEATVTLSMINWRLAFKGLLSASDVTAHQRYQTWHTESFRGLKRNRDESYCPSLTETEMQSSELEDSGTSGGRGASKRAKA